MKQISFVLLVVLVALLIKFSYENLSQGAFVLKYDSKTNEKQVSFLIETGDACKRPIAQTAPQVVIAAQSKNEVEEVFEDYDLKGLDVELGLVDERVVEEALEAFAHEEPEILSEWLFSDFEYEKYEEAPNAEIEFASIQMDVRESEVEVESQLNREEIPENIERLPVKANVLAAEEDGGWRSWFKFGSKEAPPPPPLDEPKRGIRSFWPKRLSVSHVVGHQDCDCIPFASNFTSYDIFFAPEYRLGHLMPFVDLKGHRFDNNTYAANLGVGGRYIPNPRVDSFCEMLGFNIYYDYRQGCIGYYNQFGLGIEVLNRRWDFRANAYVPFGKRRHIKQCIFDGYEGDYYATRRDIESISYSFNAEIGYLAIRSKYFLLYAAAGPYFLARGPFSGATPGGEIRIRPQYKDYLAVDLSWRHDGLFGTIWQLEVIVNLPLYQLANANKRPCGLSDRQIYQPVERFEVMPLRKKECWNFNW